MILNLIMLDEPILVSDEEIIQENVKFYCLLNGHIPRIDTTRSISDAMGVYKNGGRKILAGIPELPSIDFSVLSEGDCKKIGWVDVEKIANELFEPHSNNILSPQYAMRNYFIRGFKTAQSLSEKRFIGEDIRNAISQGIEIWMNSMTKDSAKITEDDFQKIFKTLSQPKVFRVEVEMEIWNSGNLTSLSSVKPKITNNSIKVTKIVREEIINEI